MYYVTKEGVTGRLRATPEEAALSYLERLHHPSIDVMEKYRQEREFLEPRKIETPLKPEGL